MNKVAGLLLAAGSARRFGSAKQLAAVDNKLLVNLAIEKLIGAGLMNPYLILGAHYEQIKHRVDSRAQCVFASDWKQGMSASLQAGFNALDSDITHVLVLLADQVAITEQNLTELLRISSTNQGSIITAHYAQTCGPPTVFPRAIWPQIMRLEGDTGAKSVIMNPDNALQKLAMPEAEIDIDTPEQLANWIRG